MDIFEIISSLLTSLSILFAVYVFWWNKQTQEFNEFRKSLLYIRINYDKLLRGIEQCSLAEIGLSISNEIRAIYPDGCTKDDLIDILTTLQSNYSYNNYVVTATDMGLQKSIIIREINEITDTLREIPYRHEVTMPLISKILSNVIFYMNTAMSYITKDTGYTSTFLSREVRTNENFIQRLNNIHDVDLIYREIGEIIREYSYDTITDVTPILHSANKIVDILAAKLLKMSDTELFFLKMRDNRVFSNVSYNLTDDFPEEPIDIAYLYLEKIRNIFTIGEWHKIQECRELIIDKVTAMK